MAGPGVTSSLAPATRPGHFLSPGPCRNAPQARSPGRLFACCSAAVRQLGNPQRDLASFVKLAAWVK
jgi:hypothetical protein